MHRLRCLILLLAILGLAVRAKAQQVIQISYVGNFAPIAVGLPFSTVFSVNNYYIIPIAPGNGVYFYVTRHGVNASDQVQLHMRVTGSQITPGANCPGTSTGWSNQSTQGLTTAVDTTFGINHTLVFSGAINDGILGSGIVTGAQICLQVGAPISTSDTFDIFAVFNPNGTPSGNSIGGLGFICTGTGGGGSGFAVPLGLGANFPIPCDNASNAGGGFILGRQVSNGLFQDFGNQVNIFDSNNGTSGLESVTSGVDNTGHERPIGVNMNLQGASGGLPSNGVLLTSNGGMNAIHTFPIVNSNQQAALSNTPTQSIGSIGDSCSVVQTVAAATGTGPTLDTYIQDSIDNGTNWMDRIHFAQATGPGIQRAVIIANPPAGLTPFTTTDRGLAASSIINGPLMANFRVAFVVGGTTPSFNVSIFVNCT
jgi:hypothetical protein